MERDQTTTDDPDMNWDGVLKPFRSFTLYQEPVVRNNLSPESNLEEPYIPFGRYSSQGNLSDATGQ